MRSGGDEERGDEVRGRLVPVARDLQPKVVEIGLSLSTQSSSLSTQFSSRLPMQRNHQSPRVRVIAMFAKIDSLPRT